ncbi:MarR family winged helix-turn-helix transcriptional regulator [Paenibacillus sp. HJGM_3]|uniref:MarR family winged helix-turn-helix transcriptional regulator n=1 Tax=Paenibacillus sp. HJGM_3 TaxID=3379816 RepID=UPI00385CD1D1
MPAHLNGTVFEQSVGFQLGVTYRKISHLFTQRLKPYNITPEQWIVLYTVCLQDGMMQKEIAELTEKDRPTTTRILDALEAKGLVHKTAGESDRRSFHVYGSESGRTLLEQTVPIERQTVEDATAGLSSEEHVLLLQLLRRIGGTLDSESHS